jgi:hypothetical protein
MARVFRIAAVLLGLAAPYYVLSCTTVITFVDPTTSSSGAGGAAGGSTSAGVPGGGAPGGEGPGGRGGGGSGGAAGGAGGAGGAAAGGGGIDAGRGSGGSGGRDGAACNTTVTMFPVDPSPHVPLCSPVVYTTNPPTSGPHYPLWAAFKTYAAPVPRGFWVHDLEHGAVVITYNCPSGCDAELASLSAWLDTRPQDPLCSPPLRHRIVVTPDPLLDVPFAASAWGWALASQCFDLDALGAFIDAHYAMAPENVCADGVDVSPDAGYPPGCGELPDGG